MDRPMTAAASGEQRHAAPASSVGVLAAGVNSTTQSLVLQCGCAHHAEGCYENSKFMAGPGTQQALSRGIFLPLLWDRHRNELDMVEEDKACWERPQRKSFFRGQDRPQLLWPIPGGPRSLIKPQVLRGQPHPPLLTAQDPSAPLPA